MLRARIATAAVLLCGFLAALFLLERHAFAWLVGAVVVIASHEWAALAGIGSRLRVPYAATVGIAYALGSAAFLRGLDASPLYWAAAAFWLLGVPVWIARGVRAGHRAALRWLGVLVIVPAAVAMVQLHPGLLLAALVLPWVADTAAYFAGRAWGRRKLAPGVSPGKTLEGAAAGLVAVAAYAMMLPHLLPELRGLQAGTGLAGLVAAALLLGVVSIYGDLFESAVKRQAGAKDSGTLLPGHGGVLDRIDSATSTLPIAALMLQGLRT